MKELLEKTTTDNRKIFVDISDEACLPFESLHNESIISPKGTLVTIAGVAPGNDGKDVLWYELDPPRTLGKICYYEIPGSLLKAGFKKINQI